jgi:hypothetical protein
MLLQLFHEIKKDRTLSNSFYEDSVSLTPKLDKNATATKTENYRQSFQCSQMQKMLNKILPDKIKTHQKGHIP